MIDKTRPTYITRCSIFSLKKKIAKPRLILILTTTYSSKKTASVINTVPYNKYIYIQTRL